MDLTAVGRLRVGVIGCGFVARSSHLPAIQRIPSLAIAGASDLLEPRRLAYAQAAGLHTQDVHADYRRLFERPDVHFVIVSVPPSAHHEVVLAALGAGKHVLCEKPLAVSLSDADDMITAATEAGLKLGVLNNYLFFPENRIVADVLREGIIGATRLVRIEALGLGMDMAIVQAEYRSGTAQWKHDPAVGGGGVFMDYGVHAAYLTEAYFGRPARQVNAVMDKLSDPELEVEDYVLCRLEFEQGYGLIELSWPPAMPSPARALQTGGVRLVGETGLVEFHYRGRAESPHSPVEKVSVRLADREIVHLVPADDTRGKRIEAFRGALEDFVRSVFEDRAPLASAEIGRRSLEVILAGYASAALGRTVALPLEKTMPVYQNGILAFGDSGRAGVGAPQASDRAGDRR